MLRAVSGFVADVNIRLSVAVDFLAVDIMTIPGECMGQISIGFERHSVDTAFNDDSYVDVG